MKRFVVFLAAWGLLASPLLAQEEVGREQKPLGEKKEKERPPRIPDGPFVPKRGMVKREKGQFWAGPADEDRFTQILTLTLLSKEKLREKLAEWPNYQSLSPEQRVRLEERIDQVRQTARKQALEVAEEFGLQIPPGQEEDYVRTYWRERVQMEQTLRQELLTKRKRLEKQSEERIMTKFPKSSNN